MRKMAVERVGKSFGRNGGKYIGMTHLRGGVNAAVGAAAGGKGYAFAERAERGVGKRLLNGRAVGLDLPAAKICTVVGDF